MTERSKTSVIIVTYNSADVIEATLAAIPDACEIVVVDNASSDGSVNVAGHACSRAVLVERAANTGFGSGCNIGARAASGDVVVFLNPDARPTAGALESLAVAARSDRSSIFGPSLYEQDGCLRLNLRRRSFFVQDVLELLPASARWVPGPMRRNLPATDVRYKVGGEVDYVQGACLAMDRQLFFDVGGFDEDFFLYSEEEALCDAVKARGGRAVYIPEARVIHIAGTSTSRVRSFALRHHYRSKVLFYCKRDGRLTGFAAALAIALASTVCWLMRPAIKCYGGQTAADEGVTAAVLRGICGGLRAAIRSHERSDRDKVNGYG